jgi:hypothetical protein
MSGCDQKVADSIYLPLCLQSGKNEKNRVDVDYGQVAFLHSVCNTKLDGKLPEP